MSLLALGLAAALALMLWASSGAQREAEQQQPPEEPVGPSLLVEASPANPTISVRRLAAVANTDSGWIRFLDSAGSPIPAVRVASPEGRWPGESDSSGLLAVADNLSPPFIALHGSFLPRSIDADELEAQGVPEIILDRGGSVIVRVTTSSGGLPVADAKLTCSHGSLVRGTQPDDLAPSISPLIRGDHVTVTRRVSTDATGHAVLEGLRPDAQVQIRCDVDGFLQEKPLYCARTGDAVDIKVVPAFVALGVAQEGTFEQWFARPPAGSKSYEAQSLKACLQRTFPDALVSVCVSDSERGPDPLAVTAVSSVGGICNFSIPFQRYSRNIQSTTIPVNSAPLDGFGYLTLQVKDPAGRDVEVGRVDLQIEETNLDEPIGIAANKPLRDLAPRNRTVSVSPGRRALLPIGRYTLRDSEPGLRWAFPEGVSLDVGAGANFATVTLSEAMHSCALDIVDDRGVGQSLGTIAVASSQGRIVTTFFRDRPTVWLPSGPISVRVSAAGCETLDASYYLPRDLDESGLRIRLRRSQ